MPDLLKENKTKVDPSIYRYQPPTEKKKKSKLLWWSVVALLCLVVLIGLGFLTKIVLAVNSTNTESNQKVGFFEQIKHLLVNPEKQLKGEDFDRLNILLAGIGGPGHQGAYLADTIILMSLKPSTDEVATISIPRDLYVEIPNYGWRKINNALAFGNESSYPGGGEALLAKVVSQVTGLPIHYYARLDFAGFRKIIDDLGGIDVYVESSFTDAEYPDYSFGYQTISFKKGWEHMSGERALQFARSRHGTAGEGSDFARSARQMKILLALKQKFFSLNTFLTPSSIVSALDDLGSHNRTNLQIWEMLRLGKLVKDVGSDRLITQVLDTNPEGLLESTTTADGAYILQPTAGDFSEIQYVAKNIFNTSFVRRENAAIEIQNSTREAGLANRTAEKLKGLQYNVIKVGNAKIGETLPKTTIYDLSGGKKPYTLVSLKNILNASVSSGLPPFLTNTEITYETIAGQNANANIEAQADDVDLLIIVGADQSTAQQLTGRSLISLKERS